jgi:hypothetical protein
MSENEKVAADVPSWMRALGTGEPPSQFEIGGEAFKHLRTFKHDFFAVTALYEGPTGQVVLKIGRIAGLFGFPMQWCGRFLAQHEARLYALAQGIAGVPRLLGMYGPTGIVHEFVVGRPLAKDDRLDDDFFPRLEGMLKQIHALDAAYVDLEKRENVLRGDDGRPYLIDFQISYHLPANRGGATQLARLLLRTLQQSDRYHLLKHWRRLRPDQLTEAEVAEAIPMWIRLHRFFFRPITLMRRQILVWLGARTSIRVRSPG